MLTRLSDARGGKKARMVSEMHPRETVVYEDHGFRPCSTWLRVRLNEWVKWQSPSLRIWFFCFK